MLGSMTLPTRFWRSFNAVLDDLGGKGYFTESSADECDGSPVGWSEMAVQHALTRTVGYLEWPFQGDPTSESDVVPYVEGFFQIASKPTDGWFHQFCGRTHPTGFDKTAGRYDYTVALNRILSALGTGYQLRSGRIIGLGSPVLSGLVAEPLPFLGDDHLRMLVEDAVRAFQTADPANRFAAVRSLADAYERVKSMLVPGKKAKSVEQLMDRLSPEAELGGHLDGLFRAMTQLSNDKAIRHHEIGHEAVRDDEDLIEFLFYAYYNVIRLSLLKISK